MDNALTKIPTNKKTDLLLFVKQKQKIPGTSNMFESNANLGAVEPTGPSLWFYKLLIIKNTPLTIT